MRKLACCENFAVFMPSAYENKLQIYYTRNWILPGLKESELYRLKVLVISCSPMKRLSLICWQTGSSCLKRMDLSNQKHHPKRTISLTTPSPSRHRPAPDNCGTYDLWDEIQSVNKRSACIKSNRNLNASF